MPETEHMASLLRSPVKGARKEKLPLNAFFRGFLRFTRFGSISVVLMIIAILIALVWANSQWSHAYTRLWELPLSISIGTFSVDRSLLEWINNGLMAIYFFTIGLEIKRGYIKGDLDSFNQLVLPFSAALGSMIVPAGIYLLFNAGLPTAKGWAIPMATGIAFCLSVLVLLGKRVPLSLKVFLATIAIIDDIITALKIAFSYSEVYNLVNLYFGFGLLGAMLLANLAGIRNLTFYLLTGLVGIWTFFLFSGVHPTIAGILSAFLIPARTYTHPPSFIKEAREMLDRVDLLHPYSHREFTHKQQELISAMRHHYKRAEPPLQRTLFRLLPFSSYVIIPLFVLSNGAIVFQELSWETTLAHPVSLGIMGGLLIGKPLGITLFSWIVCKAKWASLPRDLSFLDIIGTSFLAGGGFIIALFFSELTFTDPSIRTTAKVAIYLASLISGGIGYGILRYTMQKREHAEHTVTIHPAPPPAGIP